MKKIYVMKNLVKGLMLAAFMAVGTANVSAQATGTDGGTNGKTYTPADENSWLVAEELTANGQEVYIYNIGTGTYLSGKTPTVKTINEAYTWIVSGEVNKTCTFACTNSTADRIHMDYNKWTRKWETEIKEKSGASALTLVANTANKSYKLSVTADVYTGLISTKKETCYFTANENGYTESTTASTNNDWFFFSAAQKAAYKEYKELFNTADTLRNSKRFGKIEDIDGTNKVVNQLKAALDATVKSNYNTFIAENGGKAQLEAAINAAEDFIKANTTITGINGVNADDAQVSAIYDANGVQKSQLTKGINIVKMSNGKVKKVLVK